MAFARQVANGARLCAVWITRYSSNNNNNHNNNNNDHNNDINSNVRFWISEGLTLAES